MPTYFVMHPNLEIKATVDAPSTEKARTVFLDYLERQGSIDRATRHTLRRNLVASRLEDPNEVQVDLNLSYGYGNEGVRFNREAPQIGEEESLQEVPEPTYEEPQYVEPQYVEPTPQAPAPSSPGLTPIQKVALGGG